MIFTKDMQCDELREHMRGGNGTVKLTALCPQLPANLRLFSRITLAPGASIGEHAHENEAELFYFLSGSATLLDDGVRTKAAAGDVMLTASGHSHSVINEGDEDVVILAVIVK